MPCHHEGICKKQNGCVCAINNKCCEKFCGCSSICEFLYPGCQCYKCNIKCLCVQNYRECDPNICKNCLNSCDNIIFNMQKQQTLEIKRSNFCDGLGLYSQKEIKKNTVIGEYIGIYLQSFKEFTLRQTCYTQLDKFFCFNLGNTDYSIDASYFGNETRFINHNIDEGSNLEIKCIFTKGFLKLLFIAKKNIGENQELYFNYGERFKLQWKKYFNKQIKQFYNSIKHQQLFKKNDNIINL